MDTLFLVKANITPSAGKKLSISSYVRANNAQEASTIASARLVDMGCVKIGKIVEVDTDGIWIVA